jgi:hypothetical protein
MTSVAVIGLLLSVGWASPNGPCQTAVQNAARPDASKAKDQDNATVTVCPYYPYGFYPGYCAWYAQQCGGSPTSINLRCDHGSGGCPDFNCEQVRADKKLPVQLTEKHEYSTKPELAPYVKLQSPHPVRIQYQPKVGPKIPIDARINRIKIQIQHQTDMGMPTDRYVYHGYEASNVPSPTTIDDTGNNVKWLGDYELDVEYPPESGGRVYVVTYQKLPTDQ